MNAQMASMEKRILRKLEERLEGRREEEEEKRPAQKKGKNIPLSAAGPVREGLQTWAQVAAGKTCREKAVSTSVKTTVAGKRVGPPSLQMERRRKRRGAARLPPNTEAVTLTTKGGSLAEAMTAVKQKIPLGELGIASVSFRRARTGGV